MAENLSFRSGLRTWMGDVDAAGTRNNNARFPFDLLSDANGEDKKFCIFNFYNRLPRNEKKFSAFCALPFPQELNDALNVSYNTSSFGVVGAGIVGALSGNISGESLDEITQNATRILKKGVGTFNVENFFKVAASTALKSSPGLRSALNNNTGTIENPFMANTFSGVGFREFSFSFNLTPKNFTDSTQLYRLIRQFKTAMMPRDKTNDSYSTSPSGLINSVHIQNTGIQSMPDFVDVRFYPTTKNFTSSDTGKLLFSIDDAVLTKFDVNYSGDTPYPVFHRKDIVENSSPPYSANITINLKETVVYTRERCESDYSRLLRGLL